MRMSASPTERQRGAVAVMVAIVSTLLVVCIAFAVDLGYAWQVKRSMVKATDAAALAAAHEARDQSRGGQSLGSGNCSPTAVQVSASDALAANRSDTTMDFCVIARSSTTRTGIVTVRATSKAKMSFSRIIGFDEVTVHSSTSALWERARLLPFAACAVKGQSEAADWVDDPTTPTTTELQASSADTSTLCSGGKSAAFGVIDLASSPATATSFSSCRTDSSAIASDAVGWFTDGYAGNIPIGSYRCATAGQYYGTATANVDRAICLIAPGSIVALPIVTERPRKNSTADSKQWIVKVSGFALTRFDDYTGNNGADVCSGYRSSGAAARSTGSRRTGDLPGRFRAIAARRAAPGGPVGDVSIAQSGTWPTSVEQNSATTLTVTVTNSTDSVVRDLKVRFKISAVAATPSGCTVVSDPTFPGSIFDCALANTAKNATVNQSFTLPTSTIGPVTVLATVTSASTNDSNPGNNTTSKTITITAPPTTTTSSTTTTSTTTTTLPPTTTTTVPIGSYRELHITLQSLVTDASSTSDDLTVYRICAVNVSTAAAATSLTCDVIGETAQTLTPSRTRFTAIQRANRYRHLI